MKYAVAILLSILVTSGSRAQWEHAGKTQGGDIVGLATIGNQVLASAIIGPLYYSSDNGSTWRASDAPPPAIYISTEFATMGSNIFAGSTYLEGGGMGIFVSTDSGMHWTARNNGLTNFSIVALEVCRGNLFAAACLYNSNANTFSSALFSSTDEGATWCTASNRLPLSRPLSALTALDTDLFVVFDTLYRSSNLGKSWTPLSKMRVTSFLVMGNMLFANTPGGIVRTSDYGSTWIPADAGLPSGAVAQVLAVRDSMIFASTDTLGPSGRAGLVFLSTDSGNHWRNISAGLDTDNFISMAVNSEYVFGGTAHAAWRRSLADILGLGAVKPEAPPMESLRSFTQIGNRLTAQFSGNLEIHIANLLGAEVLSKRGTGTLDVDLSPLPAGVYFAIVQAGGAREVRRVAVVHYQIGFVWRREYTPGATQN